MSKENTLIEQAKPLLAPFRYKIQKLSQESEDLRTENAILREEVLRLEILTDEKEKTIESLQIQMNRLKLATNLDALEISPDDKASIQRQIDLLIGEIDHCLKLLND